MSLKPIIPPVAVAVAHPGGPLSGRCASSVVPFHLYGPSGNWRAILRPTSSWLVTISGGLAGRTVSPRAMATARCVAATHPRRRSTETGAREAAVKQLGEGGSGSVDRRRGTRR